MKDQFEDSDDAFEYIPVRLKALVGRSRSNDQESATGFYPHAGLLSTFQYLSRYPTTETNAIVRQTDLADQHAVAVFPAYPPCGLLDQIFV